MKNTNTGVEAVKETGPTGQYIFDFVPPGNYVVTAEAAGFSTFQQENVSVLTRGDVTVNITLKVGGVTETVSVEASVVQVEFNTTTMSQTVTGKMLQELPVLARNPFTLVLLDPAVVNRYWDISHRNPFYMQSSNGVDVGGSTGGRNDLLLDGVPIGVDSRGSYSPPMDAVQEVAVLQNSVDAEFGHSAGGVLTVSMKAGTNEYHGTAYYFGRNPKLNAVSNSVTHTPNPVRNHVWGGTAGGPVLKNRLFTFFSYE
ncbi:MAG: carboxypeptidase-like regulatory domain-containing protein, partial [Acidobacteriota bacterium]